MLVSDVAEGAFAKVVKEAALKIVSATDNAQESGTEEHALAGTTLELRKRRLGELKEHGRHAQYLCVGARGAGLARHRICVNVPHEKCRHVPVWDDLHVAFAQTINHILRGHQVDAQAMDDCATHISSVSSHGYTELSASKGCGA